MPSVDPEYVNIQKCGVESKSTICQITLTYMKNNCNNFPLFLFDSSNLAGAQRDRRNEKFKSTLEDRTYVVETFCNLNETLTGRKWAVHSYGFVSVEKTHPEDNILGLLTDW